jgi:hypothetical protein
VLFHALNFAMSIKQCGIIFKQIILSYQNLSATFVKWKYINVLSPSDDGFNAVTLLTNVFKCSWLKCSEVLSNRVSNIVRIYTDHMKIVAYFSFITFFHVLLVPFFIIVYMVASFVSFYLIL